LIGVGEAVLLALFMCAAVAGFARGMGARIA
jgi:hypothetical protein